MYKNTQNWYLSVEKEDIGIPTYMQRKVYTQREIENNMKEYTYFNP